MAYVQLATEQVISGIKIFSGQPLNTSTIPTSDNTNKIPNTSWVKSVLGSYAPIYDTTNTIVCGGIITNSINTSSSGTLILGGTDTVEIGSATSRGNATVTIGGAGTGNINLGGNETQIVRMFGDTTGTNYKYNSTNLIDNYSNMSLYDEQIGELNIGTSENRTGNINIGTGGGVNPINIGSTGLTTIGTGGLTSTGLITATGGIKGNSYDINLLSPSELAFGPSVTNDIVRIAEGITTGQVLIGNGASCNGSVYIMTSGTSSRTIGIGSTTATTTINLNGTVTLQKPLILGSLPTVNTQLGFQQDGTINASVVLTVAGAIKEIMSITIPNAGKYYIQANTAFPSVVSLYNSTSISSSNTVNNTECQTQMGSSGSGNNYHNISGIFTVTAGQIFYLLATSGTVPQTMQVVFLRATRIA